MKCPKCGANVRARARVGEGTQLARKVKKLSQNHLAILGTLHGRALSVRGVQNSLYRKGIKRASKKGAGFNYHTVQADLSILLGIGLVRMIKKGEEMFDASTGRFVLVPAPHYYIPKGSGDKIAAFSAPPRKWKQKTLR